MPQPLTSAQQFKAAVAKATLDQVSHLVNEWQLGNVADEAAFDRLCTALRTASAINQEWHRRPFVSGG